MEDVSSDQKMGGGEARRRRRKEVSGVGEGKVRSLNQSAPTKSQMRRSIRVLGREAE